MNEKKKKQVPLRLSEKLYNDIAAWAEDDFRSVNGQIEYLLTECVRQRKKNGKYVSEHLDEPLDITIESIFYKKTSSGKELVFSIYFYSIWINFLQPGVIKMFIHPFLPLIFRRNLLGSLITADERQSGHRHIDNKK